LASSSRASKLDHTFRPASAAQNSPRSSRAVGLEAADKIKTRIDLSNISRPGGILNAIRKQRKVKAESEKAGRH
jgi:hypothetical protein